MDKLQRTQRMCATAILKQRGVTEYEFKDGGKHRYLTFIYAGVRRRVTIPTSPRSDISSCENFMRQKLNQIFRGK